MGMNPRLQTIKYVVTDVVAAALSYALFFSYRKIVIESEIFGVPIKPEYDEYFFKSLLGYVTIWMSLYLLSGNYQNVFRRSRLKEFVQTLVQVLVGILILFFALILDDTVIDYKTYYTYFWVLFTTHFTLTYIPRLALTSATTRKIHRRIYGFKTLIVGSNEKAVEIVDELEALKRGSGNLISGFVSVENHVEILSQRGIPYFGTHLDLLNVIDEHQIEEVIIAIESHEHGKLEGILNALESTGVMVKIIPDTYDIISGKVRMQSIFGVPLIEIRSDLMPAWEFSLKRIMDIVLSALAMLMLLPVYVFTGLMVVLTSRGPIFFTQERIGLHRKPFQIIKFRSMVVNAEALGPQLSSEHDERITGWGRIMRKFRLDELPQFWNVLRGDMSIVGPRPERQFYIDQIEARAPHYRYLHRVKPGITSWGMVKYGYASTVDEMVQRMKYDVLYIENMSLLIDIKILIYTVLIVLQGRGK